MTDDELDHLFTYHPPTDRTTPRYEAIRAAQDHCVETLLANEAAVEDGPASPALYEQVNSSCKHFAKVVLEQAPGSADRSAAIRCIRLARNAQNELLSQRPITRERAIHLVRLALAELIKARWQANAAIAVHFAQNREE